MSAKREEPKHEVREVYQYLESGLDNVYLQNVEVATLGGETRVLLRALPTLNRVVAFCFAFKPARLQGREVRFIRKVLGRSGKDFAESLALRPESLSRLEAETEPVSDRTDKLVRLRCFFALAKQQPDLLKLFNLDEFQALIDAKVPEDDGHLGLFVRYTGDHVRAPSEPEELKFEFKDAA